MNKYITIFIILLSAFLISNETSGRKKITMYFFDSGICPSCKRAKADMPALKKKYPGLRVYTYSVRNKRGKITRQNRRNIRYLISILQKLQKKAGNKPVIISGRGKYRFFYENGVPYYKKRISQYTVLKKEIPVPVFIIGNEAVVGYDRIAIERKLRSMQ